MTSADRQLERGVEWEPLSTPLRLEHLHQFRAALPDPFAPGITELNVSRDGDLQLTLVTSGVATDRAWIQRAERASRAIPPGRFIPLRDVSFEIHGGALSFCLHMDPAPCALSSAGGRTTFEQRGTVRRVLRTWPNKWALSAAGEMPHLEPVGVPAWRSDWYINGPRGIRFTGKTERRRLPRFHRDRDFNNVRLDELPDGDTSWDHVVVSAGSLRFAVCTVPAEHAPTELGATSLEFLAPFPDQSTRTAVSEILSFVLGRRLMRMGSTVFDASGATVEEEAVNPWAFNVCDLCLWPARPPLPWGGDGAVLQEHARASDSCLSPGS